jgi:hypothetical protein
MGWGRVAGAVAKRPRLWPAALRQSARLAPRGWWHRPPFLPVPDAGYLRFRSFTQYGDAGHAPEPGDVVQYLGWCRQLGRPS